MSLTIGERPLMDPVIQDFSIEDNQGAGFWLDRIVKTAIDTLSSTQVQVVCTRVFASIALVGAGIVAGLAAFSIVALPVALFAIPAVLLAGYALWHSTQLDDYEESEMLIQLREDAEGMPLEEVVDRHGWDKIFEDQILTPSQFATHYRRQVRGLETINDVISYYKKVLRHATLHNNGGTRPASFVSYSVPHPREEAYRWHREIETLSFEQILQRYHPIEQFETLGIIGHNEMQKIRELRNTYEAVHEIFKGHEAEAQVIYDRDTGVAREQLNAAMAALAREEAENGVIQALNGLPNEELHSELRIRNEFGEQLRQARVVYEQAIARLGGNGQAIIREHLSPENREEYDRLAQEQFVNDRRIRQTMDAQLAVDRNFFKNIRRPFLEGQRDGILARLEARKRDLQLGFDAATVGQRNVRDESLAPHRVQFDNIIANLTLQYRAYFGQFRR